MVAHERSKFLDKDQFGRAINSKFASDQLSCWPTMGHCFTTSPATSPTERTRQSRNDSSSHQSRLLQLQPAGVVHAHGLVGQ